MEKWPFSGKYMRTPFLYKQQNWRSRFTEYSSFMMHKFSSFRYLCSSRFVCMPSQEYFPCYLSSFPVIHFCHLVRFLMHTTFAMSSASKHQKYNHLLCYRNVLYITRWQWRWYQQQRVCPLLALLLSTEECFHAVVVTPIAREFHFGTESCCRHIITCIDKIYFVDEKRQLWVKLDLDGLNVFLSIFFYNGSQSIFFAA